MFQQDPEGHRYPVSISKRFPGVAGPIDTAFYDRRDSLIYFFRNTLVRMASSFSLWHMTRERVIGSSVHHNPSKLRHLINHAAATCLINLPNNNVVGTVY